ncbi:peptidyl prolyl 4-hydroxylase subunit alpha [Sphingomonas ginkgonis]|uniref:Peptidyl prolyl 4-hydroxylase subunit alpha n=1 Tax=Sphingomonas ginkgonis TaxID=2315330 RepID=A0A429VA71_9SPHN|nr:2OG-Fe(II) oxygenase [Sphingomonas ginkgonis]RST30844.1 peptidyl prolyl 4-hydroxylase subunit alpha [Sphingomonas ginkgonis]
MIDPVRQAAGLLQRGDVQGAARLLKQAEVAGDGAAARELGLWLLSGQLVRRDLPGARAMFARAASLGDAPAEAILRAFVAQGIGGSRDWAAALQMLRDAAATDESARKEFALLGQMSLDSSGDPRAPSTAEIVSEAPLVRRFPKLLTDAECDYLIAAAEPLLQPSVIVDPATGEQRPNPIRTSSGASFPFVHERPAIHALNRRLAAASGTEVGAGEPLQVLRYAPGEEYRLHSDALPGVVPAQQRRWTFLVWLNDEFAGGETAFPKAGLRLRGRKGDGLLFRNVLDDGRPDDGAVHAGLPVTAGVKLLASRWIRAAPLQY